MEAIRMNHEKELQLLRDSKQNEFLRQQKAQTDLIKTQ
jgi:hypothetical protein